MKISIAIPNFNHGQYVGHAIRSVLDQVHGNVEVLVCDDGSTDGSQEKIRRFEADPRVKATYLAKNGGYGKAFENCFKQATGDLFCGLGADDYFVDNEWFAKAVKALKEVEEAGGVYSQTRLYQHDGETVTPVGVCGYGQKKGWIDSDEFLDGFLSWRSFVPGYSSIWRLETVKAIGGYPMDLGPQADYFVNHAIPALNGVVFIEEITAASRLFGNRNYNRSATEKDKVFRHAEFEKRLRNITGNQKSDMFLSWRKKLITDLVIPSSVGWATEEFSSIVGI